MKISEGGVTTPQGFLAQGSEAGINKKDRKDLALIYSTAPCSAAGVYTSNLVCAACIDLNREHLQNGRAQAVVVNSGNANACTGPQGMSDARRMAELSAKLLGLQPQDVVVASTGVIGVAMPMERIEAGIRQAAQTLAVDGGHNAAQAIMTTDLRRKEIAVTTEIQGKPVHIGAMAKGSGMIHPNMATMLAFITTDASISSRCLEKTLKDSVRRSYNMVSVDRDTSTNDMAVILANGLAGNPVIDDERGADYQQFKAALDYVNIYLAKMIARDGEGANHLIEVRVKHAGDEQTARLIARSITASNLTKAAVFGKDANWGRILCAAGYSGAKFNVNKVDIYLGREKMAENGIGVVFDEEKARAELEQEKVLITVDLKSGSCEATAWGCDLSYEYVRINADYRT